MQDLIRKARKGDADAFVALMEESKKSMYKVAKGFFRNEHDVADAMSETILLAFEHIGELKEERYFQTWLIRILINTCNRMVRDRKRLQVVEFLPEEAGEDNYSDIEFRELLKAFPEDCRIIMLLYYGEKLNTREIAEVLNMNENTVKSKLLRTRKSVEHTFCHA